MALLPPITDLLSPAGIVDQQFKLVSRQEYSRVASGMTYGRDLGPAIWKASFTTNPMYHDDALTVEARINSLDGVNRAFYMGDVRRKMPRAYPTGNFADTGKISAINANGRMLSLNWLPANFVITAGDYMQYTYAGGTLTALLQVVNNVTATAAGVASNVEFRPFIPVGTAVNDVVKFKNPQALFTMDPDSFQQEVVDGCFTQLSFSATQSFLR